MTPTSVAGSQDGTVLLISNRRPSEAGGRAEKFATRKRLLSEQGWQVVIGYVPDPYLITFIPGILSCLLIGWREDVDVVNSINNPFHLHLVGWLVSLALHRPWVAELRDPIAEHPDRDPDSMISRLASVVESIVVKHATKVIWFDGIQLSDDYFVRRYPLQPREKFEKIPFLGFESARFDGAPERAYNRFTITYAGSFYEGWIEPDAFLQGLSRWRAGVDKPSINVQFYGDWADRHASMVADLGLEDCIETHGFVPYDEIVPVLKGSDLLLHIGGSDPGNAQNIPSKVWDYIGAETPILAIVNPEFRVADFIREYQLGIVCDPSDSATIASALDELVNGEFIYAPDSTVFERFRRERPIEAIAQVLSETQNS